MKATITWDETWRRTAEVEVQEWEVRDAFGVSEHEPITGDQLYEYLETIEDAGEGIPWITGQGMEGYDFMQYDLTEVVTDEFGSSNDHKCWCIGLDHHRKCPKWVLPI
ncbi:hypothetical protein [Kribbella italica]|uniref:Uncharacterized protein n=1 Tax=Kribbella italica TaxID=1540520 RepID=A0A7W9J1J9_9ACTN|nr:hypothetical protein [Kribbella italica]MBB5833455.1 hypothetical protein [Kribbella italica]